MDSDLLASLVRIASRLKSEGLEREAAWMQTHLAYTIRDERPRRKRGIEVTLSRTNRRVKLDADRVKELMRNGE